MLLKTLGRAWRTGGRIILPSYFAMHETIARLTKRQRYVVDSVDGRDPCRDSTSAAVFCHYDRHGSVHEYVEYYLKCLCHAGFRIYFVTNAPCLTKEALNRLAPLCAKIIRRKNIGHDFGAYKEGILAVPNRQELARLLVVNDSVYGPFKPLERYLEAMSPDEADVWGLTDSFEIRYHLQSYFILFHRAALRNDLFERFWRELPFVSLKRWVIHRAEVGLSQSLAATGIRVKSQFPYEDITGNFRAMLRDSRAFERKDIREDHRMYLQNLLNAVDAGIPLNPTHFFWEVLIGHMGFPFIKRDLLQNNPASIAGVSRWRELVQANSAYDLDLIARHQKLRLKNRSL